MALSQLTPQLRPLSSLPVTIAATGPVASAELVSVVQALTLAGFDRVGLVDSGLKADPRSSSLSVVIEADGVLSVDATGAVTSLTGTLRAMVPNPAGMRVSMSLAPETAVADANAIDNALRDAGITTVRIFQRVGLKAVPVAGAAPPPCGPDQLARVAATALSPLLVRVDARGIAFIDDERVSSLDVLGKTLLQRANGNTYVDVLVQGTPDTTEGDLSHALRAVIDAGFDRIALLPDPATPKPPAGP